MKNESNERADALGAADLLQENEQLRRENAALAQEIAKLQEQNAKLVAESVKLRSVIRSRVQETMSSRLKDALRE